MFVGVWRQERRFRDGKGKSEAANSPLVLRLDRLDRQDEGEKERHKNLEVQTLEIRSLVNGTGLHQSDSLAAVCKTSFPD